MKKIAVIGEIVVEIMADTSGDGFLNAQPFTGPFPSGAPAIFADQAAKLGQPVAIVAAVGNDDFGKLNLERLKADGVDVSGVHIDYIRPTGTAFVRYRQDRSRDFIFNIRHSAAGHVHCGEAARRLLDAADHLHVMGSSLSSADMIELNLGAARSVKQRGGSISFDPNMRKEMLEVCSVRDAMQHILQLTDLFYPSGEELSFLTQVDDENSAVRALLDSGVTAIVHKRGAKGVRYTDRDRSIFMPAFEVAEIDPTGAGDSFGGAFTALWLRGTGLEETLELAAAAGAHAVMRRGPMEGTANMAELEAFITSHTQRTSL